MDEFKNDNNQQDNINSGYTVTPEGGFFNNQIDNPPAQKNVTQNPVCAPSPNYNNVMSNKKTKKEKKRHSTAIVIISCILAAIIGAGSSIIVMSTLFSSKYDESSSSDTTQKNDDTKTNNNGNDNNNSNINITIDESDITIAEAVAIKCTDSVVGIRTTTSVSDFFIGTQEQGGSGSGVVYTSDGYIITNYHVISDVVTSGNGKIDVYVGDFQSEAYPATVVGYNISHDLAVLKIDAENLTPIEIGNSDTLNVGQYVITIGAPASLEFMGSVTYGIISGLNRIVSTDNVKLIQTDAAINPGNSGGALLDAHGKLIGINSSKIAAVDFEGMGFAIPVNTVIEKCDKIIKRQGESKAYLGANISLSYTAEVLEYYGFPAGAVVISVADDSPAEKAKLKRGDIITEFNGVEIKEYTDLNDALYDCEPNEMVEITIYRNEKYHTVDITLASDNSN